jgi:hypothetical protein
MASPEIAIIQQIVEVADPPFQGRLPAIGSGDYGHSWEEER